MSDTYSETIPRTEALKPAPPRRRIWSRWPKRILLVLFSVWLVAEGLSLLVQYTRLHGKLTARLEAAFGRSVEVGRYDFSFWGGPVLEAQSVTVGEDPRFGQEYFLRAESMAVRLRLRSLLRGRIELGTLSLTRPSLNLVSDSEGDWNLAEWLPRPAGMPVLSKFVGPPTPAALAPRFRRIEVEGGRINFKLGDEKLPFAFVGVSGAVETDSTGLWRIDLTASPFRAAVPMQQAGTIRVSGHVGGTSSRLRPAALDVSWADASLPDVLRLARGDDFGIRGTLSLALNARTQDHGDDWAIQGRAELRQIHRWDLALRPDNPSINLIARMAWRPGATYMELTEAMLEAPHSNVHVSGRMSWDRTRPIRGRESPPVEIGVSSSKIDLGDLLSWVRAFHPGVADDVSMRGLADARGTLSGWPPRVVNVVVSSQGVDLSGAALRARAHLGPVQFRYDHGIISFPPVTLSWIPPAGPPEGSFRMDASAKSARGGLQVWRIAGSTIQVHDLTTAASAFGWNISRGWDLAGPFACDLQWQGSPLPRLSMPVGSIELGDSGGASLRAPFLNLPVEEMKARADLKPSASHITLSSAQAFGAHWSGSLDRRDSDAAWQFALSADRLAATDLDRWLNPRWRESFLGRMLPFLNPRSAANAVPEETQASGRLSVGQFTLAPLAVRNLVGNVKIDGRHIEITDAAGQFYSGTVGGSFTAGLGATPAYHADLDFTHVDMAALIAATPSLAGLTAESAAGQISFDALGATRADLITSLTCQGNARVAGAELVKFDLWKSLGVPSQGAGATRFPSASATFSCAQRKIDFRTLSLASDIDALAEGSGTIDFNRNLDLRFQVRTHFPGFAIRPGGAFRLTGSLAAPQANIIPAPPPRRTR